MRNLTENIKRLCRKNGISVYQLEKTLGFKRTTINQWRNHTPDMTKVQAVADYFHTDISELMKYHQPETLFERVNYLADKHNLSVFDLASELDMGYNSIYQWQNSDPSTYSLQKVADYFDVSTDYLLNRKPPKSKDNLLSKDAQQIAELYDSFDKSTQKVIKKLFQSLDENPM